MATIHQTKPAPAGKHEHYVEQQLHKARKRIRALDLTAGVLGFLIGTFVYTLGMALADRFLELPSLVRQIGFSVYLLAAVSYLAFTLGRGLFRQINPYYAALQVERTIPEAKNSVVNWLDLQDQNLPAAIRGAVSHRAAKNLSEADLDSAISARRALWLTGITFALFLALFTVFALGPRQFFSLLHRAFKPFSETTLATRTHLQLTEPEGGNITVPVGRAFTAAVRVEGRIPQTNRDDSLKLLFKHQTTDPYEELPLQPKTADRACRDWSAQLEGYQVQNGFWYKVVGGDAETAEYRVQVRSNPLLTDFQATYHFRPYLHWADETLKQPNLEGLRGTEITLDARANRQVKEGLMKITSLDRPIVAELPPGDPQLMRFKFTLEKDGSYQIFFKSVEDEQNLNPMPYTIKVLQDHAPRVDLTKPGQDIQLPANGLLRLDGKASDDFGLSAITLQLRQFEGKNSLLSKPYRDKKAYQLPDGRHIKELAYKDFVELEHIKLANGEPLKPGMVLEYWLEAKDNCDYPHANTGRTEQTFKILITEPEKNQEKQQQEKKEAKEDLKKHEEKQDEQKKNDSQKNQEQPKGESPKKDEGEKDPNKKPQEGAGGNEQNQAKKNEGKPDPNSQSQPGEGEAKKDPNNKPQEGEGKQDPNQKQQESKRSEQEKVTKEQADKLNQAIKDQQKQEGKNEEKKKPDEEKGENKKPGEEKGENKKPGEEKGENKKPGEEKGENKKPGEEKGENKKPGEEKGENKKPGEEKGENKKPGEEKGENKKPGEEKGENKKPGEEKSENKKPGEEKGENKKPGEEKGENKKPGEEKGENKKPGEEKGENKKPGEEKGENKKPGEEKGENKKPGEEKGENKKPGEEKGENKKPGEEKGENKKPGEEKGENKKPGEEKGENKKPGEEKGENKKSGEEKGENKKPGEEKGENKKPGEEKGENKKPGEEKGENKKPGEEKGENKKPGEEKGENKKPGEEKGENKKPGEEKGENKKPGEEKGENKKPGEEKGENKKPGEEKGENKKPGEEKGENKKPGEENRTPGEGKGESTKPGDPNQEAPPGEEANPEFQKKAGELQLEDFRKKVNKDVLKKANMTEQEYKDFLKSYEEMLKRKNADPKGQPEKLSDPKRGGGNLANQGPRKVESGPKAKDRLDAGGAALPPPEFKEAYKEFTEKLSTLKKGKDKK